MRFFNLVILFLVVFISSCHKDEIFYNEEITTQFTAKIYEEVNGSVMGYVYDENNQPVSGAQVQTYDATTTTNDLGIFIFKDIRMDKQGTYIKVTKPGYIVGSDRIYPDKAALHSYIRLLKDTQNKSFAATTGGEIEMTGGGTITFKPNSIKRTNGEDYNGEVKLTARYIDPTSPRIGDEMPGGLIGIDFQGSTVVLGTAGMFVVEMKASNGGELNLRDGSRASFKIPAKTGAKLSTIALWSFDEGDGVWREEGQAELVGNNYEGEVSHFSFWNCDAPFPLVQGCGRVLDQNGNPVASAKVSISAKIDSSNLGTGYGYTDEAGYYCGKIPKGAVLMIQVQPFGCNGSASTIVTIGPFYNDVIFDDIIINVSTTMVSGTINCNGSVISNGFVVLKKEYFTAIIPAPGGIFSFNMDQYFCNSTSGVQIFGLNADDNKSSIPQVYDENMLTYDLNLCNLACNLNGVFSDPCNNLEIVVTGGSGNYTYLWSNGLTTASIPMDSTHKVLYSVTVTDMAIAGCTQIFTKQVDGIPKVEIYLGGCNAPFYLYAAGLNFESAVWSTGETATGISVNPTVVTTYTVTVTNTSGCTATATYTLDPSQVIYISSQPVSCSKNLYSLDGMFDSGTIGGWAPDYWSKVLNGPQDLINLNVFETGYNLNGVIFNSKCQDGFEIQLPHLEQLKVTNLSDSITLIGNKIEYTTIGSCYNCTEGTVVIYAEGDLINNLVNQNNTTGLPPGYYYVVVPDAATGCFVAHKRVKIL